MPIGDALFLRCAPRRHSRESGNPVCSGVDALRAGWFALRAAVEASAFGGSLSLACARESNQREHTPARALFWTSLSKKVPGSRRLKIRPQNNSHVPVLRQFCFPRIFSRIDPAPSMGPIQERAHPARRSRGVRLFASARRMRALLIRGPIRGAEFRRLKSGESKTV